MDPSRIVYLERFRLFPPIHAIVPVPLHSYDIPQNISIRLGPCGNSNFFFGGVVRPLTSFSLSAAIRKTLRGTRFATCVPLATHTFGTIGFLLLLPNDAGIHSYFA